MKYFTMVLIILIVGIAEAKSPRRGRAYRAKSSVSQSQSNRRVKAKRAASPSVSSLSASSSCSLQDSADGSVPAALETNLSNLAVRARSMGINGTAVKNAFNYYRQNYNRIGNKCYLSIVDFNLHDSKERFFIFDINKGSIEALKTSSGSGSDRNNDGYAESFSNKSNSNSSSLGFYETDTVYGGKHGASLRLNGKSSTNNNARNRAVVIHQAGYVANGGRSWGCFAVEPRYLSSVISRLKNGSVIYAYHRSLSSVDDLKQYAQNNTDSATGTL